VNNGVVLGQTIGKEVINMDNAGVKCEVCECMHNNGECKCELSEITITEGNAAASQNVEIPHYCQNYEQA
jgi:hypothetical protein